MVTTVEAAARMDASDALFRLSQQHEAIVMSMSIDGDSLADPEVFESLNALVEDHTRHIKISGTYKNGQPLFGPLVMFGKITGGLTLWLRIRENDYLPISIEDIDKVEIFAV
jgi:hypothetical protein